MAVRTLEPAGDHACNILVTGQQPDVAAAVEGTGRWSVLLAESANAAQQILALCEVALIVAEEHLPASSGVEFLAWAQVHHPSAIRILLTGDTGAEEVAAAAADGRVWHHVRKPWDSRELINLIARGLEYRDNELALQRAERRYRELLHQAQVGIARLTQDGRIMEANRALALSLSFSSEEDLIGLNIKQLCQDRECWHDLEAELLIQLEVTGFELALRSRESRLVYMLVNASIRQVDQQGVIEASLLDTTRQRRAIRESAELREQVLRFQKSEAIGALASGYLHDFKNQLMVMLMTAMYAKQELKGQNHDLVECMVDIERTARNAGELCEQALRFVRTVGFQPSSADLNEIVEQVSRLVSRGVGARARIILELAEHLPLVMVDQTQIHHCLLNLCLNACQAIKDGGHVTLQTRIVKVGQDETIPEGRPDWLYVQARVLDSGTGMSPEVLERIFDPFFTTKDGPDGRGSGLGLAMVQGIVKQHDGLIHAQSIWGEGSCFTISLPAHERSG